MDYSKLTDSELQSAIDAAWADWWRLGNIARPAPPTRAELQPLEKATEKLEALQAENCKRLGIQY